jgi:hypothetical protein
MPTALSFDPGTWNSTVAAPYTLGAIYETGGKQYKYVQLVNDAGTSGTPGNGWVVEATASDNIVTVDRTGGSSLGRAPVGVMVGTVTLGNFCFVQILGPHSAVSDSGNTVSALGKITSVATQDGDAGATTAYTDITIGWATANATGGTVAAMIEIGA